MRASSWRGGGRVIEVIVILSQSSSGGFHRQLVPPKLEPGDDAAACSGHLRRQRLKRGRKVQSSGGRGKSTLDVFPFAKKLP